jgi:pyrroline-5-carboxylate reductase
MTSKPAEFMNGSPPTLGFLGTGAITSAIVTGLRRDGSAVPPVVVSPRSEAVSRRLAADLPAVAVARSNQDVIDRSDIVCLAIRPQQLDTAIAGLRFRADLTVVSLVAAVTVTEAARLVAPAAAVCRAIPLAGVSHRSGPIAIFPKLPDVAAVLGPLGDLIEARSEAEIMAMGAATGVISSYFALQNRVTGWLAAQGLEPATASLYTRSLLASLAAAADRTPEAELAALPGEYETKGGLNERTRRRLTEAGWLDAVAEALDALVTREDLRSEKH